jgi:hypothetical protein
MAMERTDVLPRDAGVWTAEPPEIAAPEDNPPDAMRAAVPPEDLERLGAKLVAAMKGGAA